MILLSTHGWCVEGTKRAYGEKPSKDIYSFLEVEITLRLIQYNYIFLNFLHSLLFAKTNPAVKNYTSAAALCASPVVLAGKRDAENGVSCLKGWLLKAILKKNRSLWVLYANSTSCCHLNIKY